MRTEVYTIGPEPVQINTTARDLGTPGRGLLLANVGAEPIQWIVSALSPAGVPGFPLDRNRASQIGLPEVALWAWSTNPGSLAVSPVGRDDDIRTVPGEAVTMRTGRTPALLPVPTGAAADATLIAINVGAEDVLWKSAGTDAAPDPADPATQGWGRGEVRTFDVDADSGLWVWSEAHAGPHIVVSTADDSWDL